MLRLAALVLLASSASSQCFYDNDAAMPGNPLAREALYAGQLDFTLNLFKTINELVPEDNIFFSPFSVYHSLLLAYFSSGGQTEEALTKSLRIQNGLDKVNLMTAYNLDKRERANNSNAVSYEFISANKLFVDENLNVRQCIANSFGGDLEKLNFRMNPAEARNYINEWAARLTKNNIQQLLPEDAVNQNTKLILANAAYFKGVWDSKFDKTNTRKEAFHVSETRSTLVPFMKQKGVFPFMLNDELGAQILQLPYKGKDISMFILLPPYSMKEGVTNIISNLTTETLANIVEESYIMREVIVEIPKFDMERSLPLRQVLERFGVGDLFNESADYSKLTSDHVVFDDAIHKAKIRLDEDGTVAAGVSALFGFRSSRPAEPTYFRANFPFVYLIYDRPTKSVLFMGVYRDPKK